MIRRKNIFIDLLKMLKMFLKQQKHLRLEKCISHDQTGLRKKWNIYKSLGQGLF